MNHEKKSVSNSKRDFPLAPRMKITNAELDEMVGGNLEYKAYFDDDKKIIYIAAITAADRDNPLLQANASHQYASKGYKIVFSVYAIQGPQVQ